MGGAGSVGRADALAASLEAATARDEEAAAADLAFSLRQDDDLASALVRCGSGWAIVVDGEVSDTVTEIGRDYVAAGDVLIPLSAAVLRSRDGRPPRPSERALLEVLGAACRAGSAVEVVTAATRAVGTLVRATRDHVAVSHHGVETVVALRAVEAVRRLGLAGYSASRGLSG